MRLEQKFWAKNQLKCQLGPLFFPLSDVLFNPLKLFQTKIAESRANGLSMARVRMPTHRKLLIHATKWHNIMNPMEATYPCDKMAKCHTLCTDCFSYYSCNFLLKNVNGGCGVIAVALVIFHPHEVAQFWAAKPNSLVFVNGCATKVFD